MAIPALRPDQDCPDATFLQHARRCRSTERTWQPNLPPARCTTGQRTARMTGSSSESRCGYRSPWPVGRRPRGDPRTNGETRSGQNFLQREGTALAPWPSGGPDGRCSHVEPAPTLACSGPHPDDRAGRSTLGPNPASGPIAHFGERFGLIGPERCKQLHLGRRTYGPCCGGPLFSGAAPLNTRQDMRRRTDAARMPRPARSIA